MGLLDKESLSSQSTTIRHEEMAGANTAERIGRIFDEIIEAVDASLSAFEAAQDRQNQGFANNINKVNEKVNEANADALEAKRLAESVRTALNTGMDEVLKELDKKVDTVAGKGLSTEDYTTAEKNKLKGIEAGANNYKHPESHPATMIEQDATHRFVSDAEKEKLKEIEDGANNYKHPESHPATMIEQDATHRFVSDSEKKKLSEIEDGANNYKHPESHPATMITQDATHRFVSDAEKEKWTRGGSEPILPIDGICADREEFAGKEYGTWAFVDTDGLWTVDAAAFAGGLDTPNEYGFTRRDYTDGGGTSGARFLKSGRLYKVADSGARGGYCVADTSDNQYALVPLLTKADFDAEFAARRSRLVEALPVEGFSDFRDEAGIVELSGDTVCLAQIAAGGAEKWVIRGDVSAAYGLKVEDYGTWVADFGFIVPKVGLLIQDKSTGELYRTVECGTDVALDGVRAERLMCGDVRERLPMRHVVKIKGHKNGPSDGSTTWKCSDEFTTDKLKSIKVGDWLHFEWFDEPDSHPHLTTGDCLVTNVWKDGGYLTVGFQAQPTDMFAIYQLFETPSSNPILFEHIVTSY